MTIREVQARTGIRIETLVKELKPLPHLADSGDRRWIHLDTLAEFRRNAMEFLDRYFKENRVAVNVPKGEFVQQLLPHGSDPALINFLLQDLAREKIISVEADAIDIPGRSKKLPRIDLNATTPGSQRIVCEMRPPGMAKRCTFPGR